MDLRDDETLTQLLSRLRDDQRGYMQEEEVSYGEEDVGRCGRILSEHLTALQAAGDATEGLECVRRTVEALNRLNETCDGELIETDGRELICAFLIRAGAIRGFNAEDEDVTEAWRDW